MTDLSALAKAPEQKDYNTLRPTERKRVPRRVLHFSDGILEEYSTEEEEDEEAERAAQEEQKKRQNEQAVVDPRTLRWFPWLLWLGLTGGSRFLSVCDAVGERLAWWLGITSPKYYYEIQEAIRMKEEEERRKKAEDAELAGWKGPVPAETILHHHQPTSNAALHTDNH